MRRTGVVATALVPPPSGKLAAAAASGGASPGTPDRAPLAMFVADRLATHTLGTTDHKTCNVGMFFQFPTFDLISHLSHPCTRVYSRAHMGAQTKSPAHTPTHTGHRNEEKLLAQNLAKNVCTHARTHMLHVLACVQHKNREKSTRLMPGPGPRRVTRTP